MKLKYLVNFLITNLEFEHEKFEYLDYRTLLSHETENLTEKKIKFSYFIF